MGMFAIGARVEHKDNTFGCYGTVKGYVTSNTVLVLWDAVDDEEMIDPVPSPEPEDSLELIS